jgi:hypothetical protein
MYVSPTWTNENQILLPNPCAQGSCQQGHEFDSIVGLHNLPGLWRSLTNWPDAYTVESGLDPEPETSIGVVNFPFN